MNVTLALMTGGARKDASIVMGKIVDLMYYGEIDARKMNKKAPLKFHDTKRGLSLLLKQCLAIYGIVCYV